MLGNGLAPEHVDVGNLILVSGAVLSGDSGSRCPVRRDAGCIQAGPAMSRLRLVDRRGRTEDRATWRWRGLDATEPADFLDPDGDPDTRYSLCLYRLEAPQFDTMSADLFGQGDCGGSACWTSIEDGFRYRDAAAAASGVTELRLHAGPDGRAHAYLRAGGERLQIAKGPFDAPLVVRLMADNGSDMHCWESTFSNFVRNDGRVLRAHSD